jgi:transcriptional regulator with XRE-family HTH domain
MLSNYETGEKKPSLDSLGKLLDALGLYLGKFDDALDVVNERPNRGEMLGFTPEGAGGAGRFAAGGAAGDIDVRAFIGADHELPADLAAGFAEMIKGFRLIARYVYRTVRDGGRR